MGNFNWTNCMMRKWFKIEQKFGAKIVGYELFITKFQNKNKSN